MSVDILVKLAEDHKAYLGNQISYATYLGTAKRALATTPVEPRRCMHHRSYPGDDYCRGEPVDYCESEIDAVTRLAHSAAP